MNSEEDFLGLPLEVLAATGRVAVAGARIEATARDIADALAVERTDSPSFTVLTDKIKTKLHEPLPAWGSLSDPVGLRTWISRAKSLMDERNVLLHSEHLFRLSESDWVPQQLNPRTGKSANVQAAKYRDLAARLAGHADAGLGLLQCLCLKVRPGFFYQPPLTRPDVVRLVRSPERGYPLRPD